MSNITRVMDRILREYSGKRQPTVRRTSNLKDPFKVLMSCLLSLRTTDKNTEKSSNNLFRFAKKPQDIVDIPIKKLEKLIFSSGHYKKKARVLKHVCKDLIDRFDSKVPPSKEDLLSIKGIGPKTANIVLCFAYGKNVIPVDTHVHRIPNRLGWVNTKTPEQTEKELEKVVPKKYWKEINTTLILHGQNICKAVSPKCSECFINKYCKKIDVNKSR